MPICTPSHDVHIGITLTDQHALAICHIRLFYKPMMNHRHRGQAALYGSANFPGGLMQLYHLGGCKHNLQNSNIEIPRLPCHLRVWYNLCSEVVVIAYPQGARRFYGVGGFNIPAGAGMPTICCPRLRTSLRHPVPCGCIAFRQCGDSAPAMRGRYNVGIHAHGRVCVRLGLPLYRAPCGYGIIYAGRCYSAPRCLL